MKVGKSVSFTLPGGSMKIVEQLARTNSCSKAQIIRMIFMKGMQTIDIKSLNFFMVKDGPEQTREV